MEDITIDQILAVQQEGWLSQGLSVPTKAPNITRAVLSEMYPGQDFRVSRRYKNELGTMAVGDIVGYTSDGYLLIGELCLLYEVGKLCCAIVACWDRCPSKNGNIARCRVQNTPNVIDAGQLQTSLVASVAGSEVATVLLPARFR